MANFPKAASQQTLPCTVLHSLDAFITRYGETMQGVLITDAQMQTSVEPSASSLERFWLMYSSELRALVFSRPQPENPSYCQIGLTFDDSEIRAFIEAVLPNWPESLKSAQLIALPTLPPVSQKTQTEFILALLAAVADDAKVAADDEPVQNLLDRQQDRSLLLNQVITKIRNSLELSKILETTVAEVCHFLQADRLLIYQFDLGIPDGNRLMSELSIGSESPSELAIGHAEHSGYITYESRADEALPSVLQYTETHCFSQAPNYRDRFLSGRPLAIDDVEADYQNVPCLLTFLKQNQVRSKVIAPIVVNQRLWGLLIAHQCVYQRQWEPWELEFLQHIAEHLAVAINQAHLYSQLQLQTHNLESCVVERTHELRDALAAAQTANRAKSEFLATMSHELRTPLTCIIGMSATLLRWSFGDISPRQRDYLTTIHSSGEHLLGLINDILEVSKIEAGRTVLEISEFSIIFLARQCLERYRSLAANRDIQLQLDLKIPAEQDIFSADPQRLRQILSNLLSNAIKFTPANGKVTLKARVEQNAVIFQVKDTGIGIPETLQPLLFEKFQQLENTLQREHPGTGLGLALAKQLVELHGGTISVSSKVGTGSIFTVRVPRQRPMPSFAKPKPLQTPEPVAGRIVLVEDNEESAGIICDMLTAAEYQVIWVLEGSKVTEQVELLQPAAVIVSVNLTGSNGYDIIQALCHSASTLHVKVLALVDSLDAAKIGQARNSGASEVLSRPISPEALLETVNGLMAQES